MAERRRFETAPFPDEAAQPKLKPSLAQLRRPDLVGSPSTFTALNLDFQFSNLERKSASFILQRRNLKQLACLLSTMASNWSDLQMDLLELIVKRLDAIVDIVRFRAVCSRWNTAAQLYMTSPMLIVPSDRKEEDDYRRFFSFAADKFYKIKVLDGFEDAWCVGSSHGWLVILDKQANPHLLHPFSGANVQLPLMNTLISFQELQRHAPSSSFVRLLGHRYISKAILVSSFNLCFSDVRQSKSFCVVALHGSVSKRRLALCKPGDNTWTHFGGSMYVDIICHNGMLYALSNGGLVEVWDVHNPIPKKVLDFKFPATLCQLLGTYSRIDLDKKAFFLESKGDLLFVFALLGKWDTSVGDEYLGYRTIQEFSVYKLDYSELRWVPVEDLSDQALFVSRNESMSISIRDFPKVKGNSIYFIISLEFNIRGKYSIGIYNFKEKKINYKADGNKFCGFVYKPSFWIAPNPW